MKNQGGEIPVVKFITELLRKKMFSMGHRNHKGKRENTSQFIHAGTSRTLRN